MKIHEFLAKIRKEQNIKQSEIADALNIKKQTYSAIENGKQRMFLDQYLKICEVLNINPCVPLEQMNQDFRMSNEDFIQLEKTIKMLNKIKDSMKTDK